MWKLISHLPLVCFTIFLESVIIINLRLKLHFILLNNLIFNLNIKYQKGDEIEVNSKNKKEYIKLYINWYRDE